MHEKSVEIRFSLLFWISLFLHLVFFLGLVIYQLEPSDYLAGERRSSRTGGAASRDVIVNINEDNVKVHSKTTVLSDKDSSARGFITREKGDRWLNNSLEFILRRGQKGDQKSGRAKQQRKKEQVLLSELNEIAIFLSNYDYSPFSQWGQGGTGDFSTIPDRYNVTMQNSLFYTNEGHFSYNTKKFKNAKYFNNMKKKIASNWFPPMIANAIIPGYAPGYMRIQAIQSQLVKLYFIMDRNGDVKDVKIVDSLQNPYLDSSCVDAVRLSQSFGKVPDDIPGERVVINFIFGYIVR
jgi:TonB family protein